MRWVAIQEEGFKYHTKCKAMQLNHLCFADDMLIYSKGEYQAVILMLRGFESFWEASGLKTNAAKWNIFSANMEKQTLGGPMWGYWLHKRQTNFQVPRCTSISKTTTIEELWNIAWWIKWHREYGHGDQGIYHMLGEWC